jgi:nucleotide-binding universal stress UspA family protein
MIKKRRAYEAGHRAKFLAVVDDSPECSRAVRFAARRAARINAVVLLLAVVTPPEDETWLGVGAMMQAEAEDKAAATLEIAAASVRAIAGLEPERIIRTGVKATEVNALIEEDEDVALLVLAAGTGSSGPGPLVASLAAKNSGGFAIPVAIVPGHLTDDEIDALA